MAVSTTTIHSETVTSHTGNWSSGPLAAGMYTEMCMDVYFSAIDAYTIVTISRIDTFGNAFQLWGAACDAPAPTQLNMDIGPCDAYSTSRAFGASVQIDIITTGTFTTTISLQGKG